MVGRTSWAASRPEVYSAAWPGWGLYLASPKAGLTGVNVHTLRHSAATAWIEASVNIKAVSTLLGHADIRITADVYGHVSDAVARAAMDTLSGLLRS